MEAEMAAKSGTKSATKSKKRTTGARVSKGYRDAASKIAELSRNPLVIEMAAAGLVAAAGVFLRSKSGRSAASKVGAGAREAASETADIAGRIGQALASAVTHATHRFKPESVSEPSAPVTKQQAAPPAKRRALPAGKPRVAPIKNKGAMPYVS
jgi:hypothetical protein